MDENQSPEIDYALRYERLPSEPAEVRLKATQAFQMFKNVAVSSALAKVSSFVRYGNRGVRTRVRNRSNSNTKVLKG